MCVCRAEALRGGGTCLMRAPAQNGDGTLVAFAASTWKLPRKAEPNAAAQ